MPARLNRREFIAAIVRAAIGCHVFTGDTADVSTGVDRLLDRMARTQPPAARYEPAPFRDTRCYIEPTDKVLRAWQGTVSAVYDVYCQPFDGAVPGAAMDVNALAFVEWMEWMDHLDLYDASFTRLEASQCFLWARMRSIDDGSMRARMKTTHLCLEDFYEALVRVATTACLPSYEMIRARALAIGITEELADLSHEALCRGETATDAGECRLYMLQHEPSAYARFVAQCAATDRHPDAPLREPVEVLLAKLLAVIVRIIEHGAARSHDQARSSLAHAPGLGIEEVTRFRARKNDRRLRS